MIGILHTWTRDLRYHPHAHFLVTAGGLTEDGRGWRKPRNPRFLLPGWALSPIFRAKVRDALQAAGLDELVPKKAWKQGWVVHGKYAGTGDTLIAYLSRYLFRPPISNESIVRFEAGKVTFRYRDGASGNTKHCTVTSEAFLGRFLQHVLPRGFTRVRHYGCFSPGSVKKLALARALLEGLQGAEPPNETSRNALDSESLEVGIDPIDAELEAAAMLPERRCPFCRKGTMKRIAEIPRPPRPRFRERDPP